LELLTRQAVSASLERLAANGWLDVRELRGGIVEIRLGAAARKLLDVLPTDVVNATDRRPASE